MSIVPPFLYGTAWKEDDTKRCVADAIYAGFRGFDTANQRKHYFEAGTGDALKEAMSQGLAREEFFIQTKFTFLRGQDHRLPYDPQAHVAKQVQQSFESSLDHLGVTYLDSYILHGPSQHNGLAQIDFDTWRSMEELCSKGLVRYLGLSNVSDIQLALFWESARIKPAFVQNRCYAKFGWDLEVRRLCQEKKIVYQGFSLLTANQSLLSLPPIYAISKKHGRSIPQLVFRFCQQIGILPITGTTRIDRMREDLACAEFDLDLDELKTIEEIVRHA